MTLTSQTLSAEIDLAATDADPSAARDGDRDDRERDTRAELDAIRTRRGSVELCGIAHVERPMWALVAAIVDGTPPDVRNQVGAPAWRPDLSVVSCRVIAGGASNSQDLRRRGLALPVRERHRIRQRSDRPCRWILG